MHKNQPIKIDGALGAMVIDDQPTHSIYSYMIAKTSKMINTVTEGKD